MQLVVQLPENVAEALVVLELARELVVNYLDEPPPGNGPRSSPFRVVG